MIELVIAGDSNELSPNKTSLHWRTRGQLVKKWKERAKLVALAALNQGLIERPSGRVEVSFVVRRARVLDADNAASSGALKAIQDGLVEAGLLGGDTLLHCSRGAVVQETGKERKTCPEVVVRLTPVDEKGSQQSAVRGRVVEEMEARTFD